MSAASNTLEAVLAQCAAIEARIDKLDKSRIPRDKDFQDEEVTEVTSMEDLRSRTTRMLLKKISE